VTGTAKSDVIAPYLLGKAAGAAGHLLGWSA